jgi:hypothetical protein
MAGSAASKDISQMDCALPGCGHRLLVHPGGNNQGAKYGNGGQAADSSCAGAFRLSRRHLSQSLQGDIAALALASEAHKRCPMRGRDSTRPLTPAAHSGLGELQRLGYLLGAAERVDD